MSTTKELAVSDTIRTAAAIARLLEQNPEVARELPKQFSKPGDFERLVRLDVPDWKTTLLKALGSGEATTHELIEFVTE